MKLTTPGNDRIAPVYTVAGSNVARPLPDWLSRRRKRSLKQDPESSAAFQLLQDFDFEEASNCLRISEDGRWIMSTGTYKPQIHLHNADELSLSFARHTKSENLTFVLLSSGSTDYAKSLHLQVDRRLEFHNLNGCHYETRIPRFGRDLAYVRQSAEALVPAVGLSADGSGLGEVFRLNLERGQFLTSYQIDVGTDDPSSGLQGGLDAGAVNVAAVAESTHGLCSFGTSIGTVEFFDPRSRGRVAALTLEGEGGITALDYSENGLNLAVGNSQGGVSLYDLRNTTPLKRWDQGFGNPIKNLIHLSTPSQEKKLLLSADKRIIKVFDEESGDLFTSVEPLVDINFVAHCPGTGMILTANEGKEMHSFFCPNMGPAPRWCSFLDNQFDEIAQEVQTETYDNYKFLTLPELKSLSLAHLIGKTNLLRPYMHGYFVATKLYDQARLIANPYIWEEERAKRIKEKVEKERSSRIRGKKVKVNQKLADKLLAKQERRGQIDPNAGVLGDSRFGKIFEDEEFAVDETSYEYRVLNPSTKIPGQEGAEGQQRAESDDDELSDEDSDVNGAGSSLRPSERITMRVSSSQHNGGRTKDTALGSRVQRTGRVVKARGADVVGEKHVTFVPESKKKEKPQAATTTNKRTDKRRSASSNTFRRL